jgi:hypothetical protein
MKPDAHTTLEEQLDPAAFRQRQQSAEAQADPRVRREQAKHSLLVDTRPPPPQPKAESSPPWLGAAAAAAGGFVLGRSSLFKKIAFGAVAKVVFTQVLKRFS